MNKIFQYIIKLQSELLPSNDKLAHFFYGFFYGILGFVLYLILGWLPFVFVIPTIFGVYKEANDLIYKNGKPELMDIFFTVLPSLIVYNLILIDLWL